MLKPRKCRKLLLIISPQLKAAKGKKLFAINGEWSGKEFITYVNASPSIRPQLGMVARKLGTIYARHMAKFFSGDRKVDWTAIQGKSGTTELPQRQTGQKALAEILNGKTGFARSVPTLVGGGDDVTTARIDFSHHVHVPNTDQKYYFSKSELEIKGVQLNDTKFDAVSVSDLVKAFGNVAEQELIERFKSGVRPTEEQYEEMQRIGHLMLQRALEKEKH